MWPFRRKEEPAKPSGEAARREVEKAPKPPEPERTQATRTAEDILRQLEAEGSPKPQAPPQRPRRAAPAPVDPALGQFLLAEGPVTREHVQRQLAISGKADTPLGQLLAAMPAPREADLFRLLASAYTIPEVDLKRTKVQVAAARSVPREVALKYKVVPIDRIHDLLCVVFAGEPNAKALEAVRRATGLSLKAFRCPPHHVDLLLRRLYPKAPSAKAPATGAVPISEQEHHEVVTAGLTRAEARWIGLHASRGPVRATRLTRR